jgi:hypothetical protein
MVPPLDVADQVDAKAHYALCVSTTATSSDSAARMKMRRMAAHSLEMQRTVSTVAHVGASRHTESSTGTTVPRAAPSVTVKPLEGLDAIGQAGAQRGSRGPIVLDVDLQGARESSQPHIDTSGVRVPRWRRDALSHESVRVPSVAGVRATSASLAAGTHGIRRKPPARSRTASARTDCKSSFPPAYVC